MHPRPGAYYRGICRTGFLPDTKEGREICAMLKVAFERRLVFTIGMSRTTGEEGVITWNDIHHKTDHRPGTQ
jgi:deltex-like protein